METTELQVLQGHQVLQVHQVHQDHQVLVVHQEKMKVIYGNKNMILLLQQPQLQTQENLE